MKVKEVLNEELANAGKFGRNKDLYVEIFVNPTYKEIEAASSAGVAFRNEKDFPKKDAQYVRFIAFPKDKKVFVFTAEVPHSDIYPKINRSKTEFSMEGVAHKNNGRWEAKDISTLRDLILKHGWGYVGTAKKIKTFLTTDWKFLNKYINISKKWEWYLKKIKSENIRGLKGI